jgi:hypothetical protein
MAFGMQTTHELLVVSEKGKGGIEEAAAAVARFEVRRRSSDSYCCNSCLAAASSGLHYFPRGRAVGASAPTRNKCLKNPPYLKLGNW